MIKDERIISTRNKYLSQGFYIYFYLLIFIFYYRHFILKQPINEFLDLIIVFNISVFYVFFKLYSHGAYYVDRFKKMVVRISLSVIVGITVSNYLRGEINSFSDFLEDILGSTIGIIVVIFIVFFLNYWWKKRNELE